MSSITVKFGAPTDQTYGGDESGSPSAKDLADVQSEVQQDVSNEVASGQDSVPPADSSQSAPAQAAATQPNPASADYDKIEKALKSGYSKDEISSYMSKSQGLSPDDANAKVVESVQSKIQDASKAGYSQKEIKDYLIENRFDGQVIDDAMKTVHLDQSYKKTDYNPSDPAQAPVVESAQNVADLYRNIYSKYSTVGNEVLGVFDEQAGIQARRDVNQLNVGIVNKLKESKMDAFVDPNTGDPMVREANGYAHPVDSSMLSSLVNSKGEIAGAIAGGSAGAALGAMTPVPGGALVGGVVGSMAGAAAGRGLDLAYNSSLIKEKIEKQLYLSQMKQAGIMDGVASVLGAGIVKLGSAGAKGVMKGWRYFSAGNTKGAYKALLENLNITDEEAKEMVSNWEKHSNSARVQQSVVDTGVGQVPVTKISKVDALKGLSDEQKAIKVISNTAPGAENAVRHAASSDPKMTNALLESINKRAKGIQQTANAFNDQDLGNTVRMDLNAYEKDVKDFYGQVKDQGIAHVNGTDFKFDLNKVAVKPVMDNIAKKISNPKVQEQFLLYATRIENASADRSFGGLIELRQAVNDFKYSRSELSRPDAEAVNKVINRIDTQINNAATEYMPGKGKQWIENFKTAKVEYAKMKQLEENAVYKAITKEPATEKSIRTVLSKYGEAKTVDSEVFNEVVDRMSGVTRSKVETAAFKNLLDKNTYGASTELQAVHFPQLAEDLKSLNIQTPEGKGIVRVVDEIAKIYRNDAVLSSIIGNTPMPKMAGSLSSNLLQKAKYSLIGAVWNRVVMYAPGKTARNMALVHQVGRLLESPLNYKASEDMVRMVPRESQSEMRSLVKDLQQQTAKADFGKKPDDFVKMYKQSKSGKLMLTDGALGKGVYLVDKVSNPTPEMNIVRHEVNMSRMATLDDVSKLVGQQVTEKDIRTIPNLKKTLQDKKYLGIRVDGKAMLFDKPE